MTNMMTFPDTVEKFMEQNKIVDTDKAYTNGAELIPIFRMKQWFEHERKWIPITEKRPEKEGWYLVFYPYDQQYEVARWNFEVAHDYEGFFSVEWASSDDVVAWMPLPAPYEVDK